MEQLEAEFAEQEMRARPLLAPMKRAMVDTGAGASVFPRGFSKNSKPDKGRRPVVLTTATDEEVQLDDGRESTYRLQSGDPVSIRHHDSETVTVPVISVGDGNRRELDRRWSGHAEIVGARGDNQDPRYARRSELVKHDQRRRLLIEFVA